VKIGGSLLELPDLVRRLDTLRSQWGPRPLLIVGGGLAADLVRAWDQQHQLREERSHWLALDSLELTARLLATLWPTTCVASHDEVEAIWKQGGIPLIRARSWFEEAGRVNAPTPPQTWETTTDAISAWLARESRAESLWLLKSVANPSSLSEATLRELVDPQFLKWTPAGIPIHWVNLRDMTQTQVHS